MDLSQKEVDRNQSRNEWFLLFTFTDMLVVYFFLELLEPDTVRRFTGVAGLGTCAILLRFGYGLYKRMRNLEVQVLGAEPEE